MGTNNNTFNKNNENSKGKVRMSFSGNPELDNQLNDIFHDCFKSIGPVSGYASNKKASTASTVNIYIVL